MRRARQWSLVQNRLRPNIFWPNKHTTRGGVLDNESRFSPASPTTSSAFRQDNSRRTMRFGGSPWAMRGITFCAKSDQPVQRQRPSRAPFTLREVAIS
jgi:hypothetical protein